MRGMYLGGYVVFVIGVFLALWKMGVLERLGDTWTLILVVLAIGAGLMAGAIRSGKATVNVDNR
jgi:hypothetical protein